MSMIKLTPAAAARRARCRQSGAEMTARNDDGNAAGNVIDAQIKQRISFAVREKELLGIVGEDTDAVDALIDHAIEHTLLALMVEITSLGERSGRYREDPRVDRRVCSHRANLPSAFGRDAASVVPR